MALDSPPRRSRPSTLSRAVAANALPVALFVFAVWTLATYLLEGRIRTLLRPGATVDRLAYALVANVLVGTVLATGVAGAYVRSGILDRERLGFRRPGRTVAAVLAASLLGAALYVASGPPSTDPVVLANVYAQVIAVSIAEVLVCWVVVGGAVSAVTRSWGPVVAAGAVVVTSAILFGAYHVAHSPPFDTVATIGTLTVVGLGTGLVYVAVRDVYATIAFHNAMGVLGVTRALAASGRLATYGDPRYPLFGTALLAVLVLVAADLVAIRRRR